MSKDIGISRTPNGHYFVQVKTDHFETAYEAGENESSARILMNEIKILWFGKRKITFEKMNIIVGKARENIESGYSLHKTI